MAVGELEARVRREGTTGVIDLVGELDSSAEAAVEAAYAEAAGGGAEAILLNFAPTDYINSTGIALIVGLLGQARSRGLEVSAVGLSDHYREIFEITRLADFMTIIDNEPGSEGGTGGSQHG